MPLQRSAHIGALTDSSYVQLVGEGVAAIDLGFPMRYTHSSLEVCDLADLDGLTRLLVAGIAAIDAGFSLDRDDYTMRHYLGIDIGTFESKGVLVDGNGRDRRHAPRSRTRCSCRSPAGPSIGRSEDWWGDFTFIMPRSCSPKAASRPNDIRAVGTSAIGPCMLPVDADGEPLMNAVLYGVDARAAKEIEELTARDRRGRASSNAAATR